MLYYPNEREIQRLPHQLKEMLSDTPPSIKNPVPITTEKHAREYLTLKVEKYYGNHKVAATVEKYIGNAMNTLLAAGFTYVNLYAKDFVFLTEPHVASALAFNELNHIVDIPDDIDLTFGLTYERTD